MADFPPIFHRFLVDAKTVRNCRCKIGHVNSSPISHRLFTVLSPTYTNSVLFCIAAHMADFPPISRRWKIGQAKIGVKSAMWRAHQFPIVFSPTSTNSEFEVEHCSTFCHRFITDAVLVDFLTSSPRQTFCPIWLVVADQWDGRKVSFNPALILDGIILPTSELYSRE